jgi:hypothetical protein
MPYSKFRQPEGCKRSDEEREQSCGYGNYGAVKDDPEKRMAYENGYIMVHRSGSGEQQRRDKCQFSIRLQACDKLPKKRAGAIEDHQA